MNKHDKSFVDGVRKYEGAIRGKTFKELCNAKDVAQMRQDIRNLISLIDRIDPQQLCASCQENPATVTQPLTGVKYCEGCYWGQAEAV